MLPQRKTLSLLSHLPPNVKGLYFLYFIEKSIFVLLYENHFISKRKTGGFLRWH